MNVDPGQINYHEVFRMSNLRNILISIGDNWLLKSIWALLVSVNDFFFHPSHDLVAFVLAAICLDTVTGLLRAMKEQNVSSSGFFRFSLKIMVYFVMLAGSSLIDKVLPISGFLSSYSIVGAFLVVTEVLSTFENIARMGFSIPTKLFFSLKVLQSEEKNVVDKDREKSKDKL